MQKPTQVERVRKHASHRIGRHQHTRATLGHVEAPRALINTPRSAATARAPLLLGTR
jgi:hypothetical protein